MVRRRTSLRASTSLLAAAAFALAACTKSSAPAPAGAEVDAPRGITAGTTDITSTPTPSADPPAVETQQGTIDISGLAQWFNGGDTTDFGGGAPPPVPPGCTYWVYTDTTVTEALARGAELSPLPVGLDERFEVDVQWREQGR